MHIASVGAVAELWRYPVKSMLGERRASVGITATGVDGDRAWALRDLESGRIASAKKFPRLLEFHARYDVEPDARQPGHVVITTPDGTECSPDDAAASTLVSRALGRPFRFECQARAYEQTGIDPGTVFGDVPASRMKPEWRPGAPPDYFELKTDSFLEIGAVYVLASGSVDYLRGLRGGGASVDRRRFRPNVYVHTPARDDGFVEDAWLHGRLEAGASVVFHGMQPTLWCVTSTLAQQELPRDLGILRTLADQHRGCLGVYASVAAGGVVSAGDDVRLVRSPDSDTATC